MLGNSVAHHHELTEETTKSHQLILVADSEAVNIHNFGSSDAFCNSCFPNVVSLDLFFKESDFFGFLGCFLLLLATQFVGDALSFGLFGFKLGFFESIFVFLDLVGVELSGLIDVGGEGHVVGVDGHLSLFLDVIFGLFKEPGQHVALKLALNTLIVEETGVEQVLVGVRLHHAQQLFCSRACHQLLMR